MHTWKLPEARGAYALVLRMERPALLRVGVLGEAPFPAGVYVYLGSARGPGGIRARLGRHLRGEGHPRWHVDYLRAVARPVAYAFTTAPPPDRPWECIWSQALAALPETWVPLPGFGASDCRQGCPAHLVAFPPETAWAQAMEAALGIPLHRLAQEGPTEPSPLYLSKRRKKEIRL